MALRKFINYIKNKTIKGKVKNKILFYSIILFLLNLAWMSLVTYSTSSSSIVSIVSETNNKFLIQTKENMDLVLKGIENAAIQVLDSIELTKYLEDIKNVDTIKAVQMDDYIEQNINILISIRKEIEYIYIIGKNGAVFSNDNFSRVKSEYVDRYGPLIQKSNGRFLWTFEVMESYETGNAKRLALFKSIIGDDGNTAGIILVFLKPEIFSDLYSDLYESERQLYVVDKNNMIISSSDKKQTGMNFDSLFKLSLSTKDTVFSSDDQKYLFSNIVSDYTDWNLYIVESYDRILYLIKNIKLWLMGSVIACTLIFILLSITLSSLLSNPIKRLLEQVDSFENCKELVNYRRDDNKSKNLIKKISDMLTFRSKLSIMLLSLIIVPVIIIMVVTYFASFNTVKHKASELNYLSTLQMKKRIEYFLSNIEKSIYNVYSQNELVNILETPTLGELSNESKVIIDNALTNIQKQNRDILYVNLYNNSNELLFSSKSLKQTDLVDKLYILSKIKDYESIWFDTYRGYYNENVITFGNKIKNIQNFSNLAYFFASIGEESLEATYNSILKKDDMAFVLTDQGKVISHKDKKLLGRRLDYKYIENTLSNPDNIYIHNNNGEESLIICVSIAKTNWRLINITSINTITESFRKIALYNTWAILISLILILVFVLYISKRISIPLNKLNNQVVTFASEYSKVDNHIFTGDEIELLSINFSRMMKRIKTLIEEVYEARVKRSEAELKEKVAELNILQAQINPHFLYNTLEIIRWKAMFLTNGENEITEITESLSDFFRLSLSKGRALVELNDEINHIKSYVKIMNCRHTNKFKLIVNVEKSILKCLIPKITLQPLVENALYHGIIPKLDSGIINITGYTRDNVIKLCVTDNGIGINQHKLKQLNQMLETGNEEVLIGYGIGNINQRIRLYFGDEYGLRIESNEKEGTVIIINIPEIYEKTEGSGC